MQSSCIDPELMNVLGLGICLESQLPDCIVVPKSAKPIIGGITFSHQDWDGLPMLVKDGSQFVSARLFQTNEVTKELRYLGPAQRAD